MHPGLILLFTGLFTILIPFKFARYIWFFSSVISLYLSVTLDFGSSLTFNYLNFEIVFNVFHSNLNFLKMLARV